MWIRVFVGGNLFETVGSQVGKLVEALEMTFNVMVDYLICLRVIDEIACAIGLSLHVAERCSREENGRHGVKGDARPWTKK